MNKPVHTGLRSLLLATALYTSVLWQSCSYGDSTGQGRGESKVFTIDGINDAVKKHPLTYRLYCGSTATEVSEKLAKSTPTDKVEDSVSLTGKSISFSSEEVKKLTDGSTCVLDVYTSDTAAHTLFQWNLADANGSPMKGVFYVTSAATLKDRKASLTVYSTFTDLSDTFKLVVKTTYPKELAKKTVTNVNFSCTEAIKSSAGGTESSVIDENGLLSHTFNLQKSEFKGSDQSCTIRGTVDGKPYKSKTPIKIAKNADGKALEEATTVSPDTATGSAGDPVPIDAKVQDAPCETKTGVAGCVPKQPAVPPTTSPSSTQGAVACDMSKAPQNNGWGWDSKNNKSCKPEVANSTQQTKPLSGTASSDCDYSKAGDNKGWGWDNKNKKSCPPR